MRSSTSIVLEPYTSSSKDGLELGVTITAPFKVGIGRGSSLWFRVPAELEPYVTAQADPFVIASLLLAMQTDTPLHVAGRVSPSLLRNLHRFQCVWSLWEPERFHVIDISADEEGELEASGMGQRSVVTAFSGGLDASCTAFRHARGLAGRWSRPISAGLLVQGLDIPLHQEDIYRVRVELASQSLQDLGLETLQVATNLRELPVKWHIASGASVAACMSVFQNRFREGLIGSSNSYDRLILPTGTNPITDEMLSSDGFTVTHDAAELSRSDKARLLGQWPLGMENLRVCWEGKDLSRNCGHCDKCKRTMLNFMAAGLPVPSSLGRQEPSADDVGRMTIGSAIERIELEGVLAAAHRNRVGGDWVRALERLLASAADRGVGTVHSEDPDPTPSHWLRGLGARLIHLKRRLGSRGLLP